MTALAENRHLCEIADMQPTPGDRLLIDALMAVKPEGLSPNAWALKAGVSRTIFNDIKKRNNARHDSLVKLLDAIDVSLAEFEGGLAKVKTEVAGSGLEDAERAWRGDPRAQRVPLVGSAVGGSLQEIEDGFELTELHLDEVLDYLARPNSIATDQTAYAVTIVGDSMAPRFEPGERAYVSPKASVGIGDDVIVQLRGSGAEDEADRVTMVLIKRLVRSGGDFVELRQFNPDMTFRVPKARIARDSRGAMAMHRVVGRL